jgi:hypothetical protein
MQPLIKSGVLKVTEAPPETTVHLDRSTSSAEVKFTKEAGSWFIDGGML